MGMNMRPPKPSLGGGIGNTAGKVVDGLEQRLAGRMADKVTVQPVPKTRQPKKPKPFKGRRNRGPF